MPFLLTTVSWKVFSLLTCFPLCIKTTACLLLSIFLNFAIITGQPRWRLWSRIRLRLRRSLHDPRGHPFLVPYLIQEILPNDKFQPIHGSSVCVHGRHEEAIYSDTEWELATLHVYVAYVCIICACYIFSYWGEIDGQIVLFYWTRFFMPCHMSYKVTCTCVYACMWQWSILLYHCEGECYISTHDCVVQGSNHKTCVELGLQRNHKSYRNTKWLSSVGDGYWNMNSPGWTKYSTGFGKKGEIWRGMVLSMMLYVIMNRRCKYPNACQRQMKNICSCQESNPGLIVERRVSLCLGQKNSSLWAVRSTIQTYPYFVAILSW